MRRDRCCSGRSRQAAAVNFLCYSFPVATRTLPFAKWLKLVARHALDDGFKNVAGLPVAEVVARLGCHRSRVYQLIEEGVLDTINVTTVGGRIAIVLVTEASFERYLAERMPVPGHQGHFSFPQSA